MMDDFITAVIAMVIAGLIVAPLSLASGRNEIMRDAIDAGVAEWRIDPKTGDRSFHWIDNNESERE